MGLASRVVRWLTILIAFGVGVICLLAAVAGLFGGSNPALDVLTHFTPFWMAGAAASAVAGLTFGRGRVRGAVVAIGLAGLALASPRIFAEVARPVRPGVTAGPSGQNLRVIQFNAWVDNADPVGAAAWLDAQKPDVVTMEEATPALRAAMAARGFTVVKGTVNTAVFSRGLAVRPRFHVPLQDWRLAPDFARARFAVRGSGATFTVVAAHVSWPTLARRWPQREALARLLDNQVRDRLIVGGDFNLTPWSFALARFDQRLRLERRDRAIPTWPAIHRLFGRLLPTPAFLPIDHIYAGPQWRTVSIRRGPRLGSDHYPLIIDLTLRP
jgi:endonuclease/exonuclease/phosphatase (EEP) superfamily protein YafD